MNTKHEANNLLIELSNLRVCIFAVADRLDRFESQIGKTGYELELLNVAKQIRHYLQLTTPALKQHMDLLREVETHLK